MNEYSCEYLTPSGKTAWATCNDVYITLPEPSGERRRRKSSSSIPAHHFVKNLRQETSSVPEGACVRTLPGSGPNPTWIYHFPYTSMLHCMADIPRSTSKWCSSFFQESYFQCKFAAGLVNGG